MTKGPPSPENYGQSRRTNSLSSGSRSVLVADLMNYDAADMVNSMGRGNRSLDSESDSGLIAPFAMYVNITVTIPMFEETSEAVEVLVVDADGQPVTLAWHYGDKAIHGFPSSSNGGLNFAGGFRIYVADNTRKGPAFVKIVEYLHHRYAGS